MLHIIRFDGETVGVADDATGGPVAWLAINANGAPLNPLGAGNGYDAEPVEEIDCYDVESIIAQIAKRLALSISCAFVPLSQSRNAAPDPATGKQWRSLNWRVTVERNARPVMLCDYSQGEGHAPAAKAKAAAFARAHYTETTARAIAVAHELETGRAATWVMGELNKGGGKPIAPPTIGEVLSSLARDTDVLDAGSFEAWADSYGMDTDSRKAESIYRECLEHATKLRAAIGDPALTELRLVASFN